MMEESELSASKHKSASKDPVNQLAKAVQKQGVVHDDKDEEKDYTVGRQECIALGKSVF